MSQEEVFMNVLYVVGSCLTKNTSANMSHNAYVQGLLENGCSVDILMAEDSWGQQDDGLPVWEQATYFPYPSVSFRDKLRKKARGVFQTETTVKTEGRSINLKHNAANAGLKTKLRAAAKYIFNKCFPPDPVYPLNHEWIKNASRFQSVTEYDLVVSNSSPEVSHKLVAILRDRHRIMYKRWVQIWEDPWYYDIYGGCSEIIREEEHYLLREATEIFYVSPLTLYYQKKYFQDCADKMKCIPLPFLSIASQSETLCGDISFGYFGDYYSHTRNLMPFYEAICKSGYTGYIYGDSDLTLQTTDKVTVSERVTLDKLAAIQSKTKVLVHLCNLCGGQIPGKIYHYSSTDKPILFILDGTKEEIEIIHSYFGKFNRYYFCENNELSIARAICDLAGDYSKHRGQKVDAFAPKNVVQAILHTD